jgi:long-chain fatty acid transport protein
MPHEISGSVAYDINKQWVVVGDLTWTNWSRFEQLTVTFDNPAQPAIMQAANYANRFRGAGGVAYRVNERWTIRGGGLYEATPVPDSTRTPRLPEVNNAGFCVGGTLRMTPSWDFDFSWSHLIPHDAPLHLVDPAAGLLDGSVRWRTDAVGFGVSARF